MNFIIWLLIGALVGWLASMVMNTDARQGALLNIVVGIIGAMIGGFLLGGPTINSNALNLTAILVSFVGAVVLLAIVNLVTRGRVRQPAPIESSKAPRRHSPWRFVLLLGLFHTSRRRSRRLVWK